MVDKRGEMFLMSLSFFIPFCPPPLLSYFYFLPLKVKDAPSGYFLLSPVEDAPESWMYLARHNTEVIY